MHVRAHSVDEGAIPPLVALASSDDKNAQRQALAALRGLAISVDNRAIIVKVGLFSL